MFSDINHMRFSFEKRFDEVYKMLLIISTVNTGLIFIKNLPSELTNVFIFFLFGAILCWCIGNLFPDDYYERDVEYALKYFGWFLLVNSTLVSIEFLYFEGLLPAYWAIITECFALLITFAIGYKFEKDKAITFNYLLFWSILILILAFILLFMIGQMV